MAKVALGAQNLAFTFTDSFSRIGCGREAEFFRVCLVRHCEQPSADAFGVFPSASAIP